MLCTSVARVALRIIPGKALFWSTIQVIFLAVTHNMGVLHSPTLLAYCAELCILAGLLWDSVTESDHPLLGGTTSSCACFRPFTILFGWEGLFDALQRLKQF